MLRGRRDSALKNNNSTTTMTAKPANSLLTYCCYFFSRAMWLFLRKIKICIRRKMLKIIIRILIKRRSWIACLKKRQQKAVLTHSVWRWCDNVLAESFPECGQIKFDSYENNKPKINFSNEVRHNGMDSRISFPQNETSPLYQRDRISGNFACRIW